MNILIISSTKPEIEALLKDTRQISDTPLLFYKKSGNIGMYFAIGGVGIMTFSYALTKLLNSYEFAFVVHCGIAGSLINGPEMGEVVWVESDFVYDIGLQTEKKFYDLFSMKLLNANEFPYSNGRLTNYTLNNNKTFERLRKMRGITINLLSDKAEITANKSKLAEVESMEGAACHYICLLQKVPFAHIRSISNRVGETDKKNWAIGLAVQQLNKTVLEALEEIAG